MFDLSLPPCSRYDADFKLDQSVLAIHDSPLYYEISEDDHPPNTEPHTVSGGNSLFPVGGEAF
jgi:hypothetical protein